MCAWRAGLSAGNDLTYARGASDSRRASPLNHECSFSKFCCRDSNVSPAVSLDTHWQTPTQPVENTMAMKKKRKALKAAKK